MDAMASQITSLTIVYSPVYSGTNQGKHQSSASLAFVWGIHRWPVNSPHKWPVTRKMFPFDDVIMNACEVILKGMGKTDHNKTPQSVIRVHNSWCMLGPVSLRLKLSWLLRYRKSLNFLTPRKMHILRRMGSKFCVKFQRAPLNFHTKFWTHTPQNMHCNVFNFCVSITISLNCDVISLIVRRAPERVCIRVCVCWYVSELIFCRMKCFPWMKAIWLMISVLQTNNSQLTARMPPCWIDSISPCKQYFKWSKTLSVISSNGVLVWDNIILLPYYIHMLCTRTPCNWHGLTLSQRG